MADDEHKALVVQRSRSLAEVGAGARKILSSVVSDALTLTYSREKALTSTVFRIGSYEFREPDYARILNWANRLDIDPEALVRQLSADSFTHNESDHWGLNGSDTTMAFHVERGAILSLALDISKLGIKGGDWLSGLSIQTLAVFDRLLDSTEQRTLSLSLQQLDTLFIAPITLTKLDLSKTPSLNKLVCNINKLSEIDLSGVPHLTELWCSSNQLSALDLSLVPKLTTLDCGCNKLGQIDLSNNPNLSWLCCAANQLTELELSNLTGLRMLRCDENQLAEIDLSNVPNLTVLVCCDNQISRLGLSAVPTLIELNCCFNKLTELDLSDLSELAELQCSANELAELDVSKLPNLTRLGCGSNRLTELDLSNTSKITELDCEENQFTELNLSSVPLLTALDCRVNQISELDLSAVPNLTKLRCRENLITRLDVTTNTALTYLHCDPSVRVVKLPSQNFKRYPPVLMRYWFDEINNLLFPMAVPLPDSKGITEITEADYNEYVALRAAAEATKGVANDDE